MDKPGVRWALAAVVLVLVVVSTIVYAVTVHSRPPVLIEDTGGPGPDTGGTPVPRADTGGTPAPQATVLYVHVAGAVRNPGLYTLPPGSRVANAIHQAGGAKADADIDAINLAERVADGEKVYIPPRTPTVSAEPSAPPVPAGNMMGYRTMVPPAPVTIQALPPLEPAGGVDMASTGEHAVGGSHSRRAAKELPTEPIDLNTATAEELEQLPGVGPSTAQKILEFRQQNGGFHSPNDLMEVGGIGEKKMAKIAPYVVVR